jgi:DNA-binding MarR family transcriptional regulator
VVMVFGTSNRLSPTLWRTCRALANRKRLRLLRHVMSVPDTSVSDAARTLGMPLSVASQYLRLLNARGLLQVKRKRRQVLYVAVHDPSLPETRILLEALQRTFRGRATPFEKAFQALTGFTHPRRIILVRAVAAGADSLRTIRVKTGISGNAALRHLRKLRQRGYVTQTAGRYQCRRPAEPLAKALMSLTLRTR